jgi:hypothetical protein
MPARRISAVCRHLCQTAAPTAADAAPAAPTGILEPQRRKSDGSWSGAPGSDPELDALVAKFRTDGYLKIPNLLTGKLLARSTAAFRQSQAAAYEDWEQSLTEGAAAGGAGAAEGRGAPGTWHAPRYFDTPKILEVDDCFLEVVEQPLLLALASKIVADDLHLFQIQARTYPADRHVPSVVSGLTVAANPEPGEAGVVNSEQAEGGGGLDGYTGW